MIKHIVLAAGGYKGLNILGVLYELNKCNTINFV